MNVIVDGLFGDEVCSKSNYFLTTNYHPTVWLRIDFGEWKHVQFVEIHNRISPHQSMMDKISDTKVIVYGETHTDNRRLCGEISQVGKKVHYMVCVNQPLSGKGIELFQDDNGNSRQLHLCEVIVLGY